MNNAEKTKTLVGMFGHTLTETGINYQFEITGKINEDKYTVQLFSWVMGDPTDTKIFSMDTLMECNLYDNREDWLEAADKAGLK